MVLGMASGIPRITKGISGRSVGVKVAVAGVRLIDVGVDRIIVGRGVDVIVDGGVNVGVQVSGNAVLVMVIVGEAVSVLVGTMFWAWARDGFGGYGLSGIVGFV